MSDEREKQAEESEGQIPPRKCRNREEIERMLERRGGSLDAGVNVVNLDNGEQHVFDDYAKAVEFVRARKGRWYIAMLGSKHG